MRTLVTVVLCCVTLFADLADARAAITTSRLVDGPVVRLELHDGCDYQFQLHSAYRSDMFFPEQVTYASTGNSDNWDIGVGDSPISVKLQPVPYAPETNANVTTLSRRISARIIVAPDKLVANRAILFYEPFTNRPKEERCMPLKDGPEETSAVANDSAPVPLDARTMRKVALLYKLRHEKLDQARTRRWAENGHLLLARIGNVASGIEFCSFKVTLRNHGNFAFPLEDIEVLDTLLMRDHLDMRVIDSPGGALPPALDPGEELTMVVSAAEPALLNRGWMLRLSPGTNIAPAQFRFNDDPPLPRPYKKLSVGLDGRGGAARFTVGDDLGFALSRSVGVRARYGVQKHFAVEGAIGYVATGAIDLGGTMTSFSGARVMAAGVYTFGDKLAPFFRAGFGIVPATITRADEPEFDIFPVVSAGVGVDAWLSRTLVVGASIDGTGGSGEMPLTLDASVHISYAWDFLDGWQ